MGKKKLSRRKVRTFLRPKPKEGTTPFNSTHDLVRTKDEVTGEFTSRLVYKDRNKYNANGSLRENDA